MVQIDSHLTDATTELGHAQITTSGTSTQTVQASAATILTAPSITFDGSTIIEIQVFSPRVTHNVAGPASVRLNIWEDSTDLGSVVIESSSSTTLGGAVYAILRRTPTAGAKVYTARLWINTAGTATWGAGDGSAANFTPAFIKVVRV